MIKRIFRRLAKLRRKHSVCRNSQGTIQFLDYRACRIEKRASLVSAKDCKIVIGPSVSVEEGTQLKAFGEGSLIAEGNNYINRNCTIVAKEKIVIGKGVTIGPNTVIYDHDHDMEHPGEFVSSPVRIGAHTWIGAGVTVLKGITIGEGCVIAAGTVVTKSIPPHTKVYDKRTKVMIPMRGEDMRA